MWTICGHTLHPGERKQVMLNMAGSFAPATLLCGGEPGDTLLITAQIHSGEYPGTPALIQVSREIQADKLRGNLLLLPCVNLSGFWARSSALVPEDGFNLNAGYPGRAGGTPGERIADYFVREIFPHVDFVLDLHSGGQQEPLTPCLFFVGDEAVREASLAAARTLEIPYLIQSYAANGEYSYAASQLHIPGLLLERGCCGFCRREWIDAYRRDIHLLLQHRGMYQFDEPAAVCRRTIYPRTVYLTAREQGLWYPAVTENTPVEKGQLLGHTEDFWGNLLREYYAEGDGIVFYYTCGLSVVEGTPLAAYGLTAFAQEEPPM